MVKKPVDTKIGGIKPSAVKATDVTREIAGTEAVGEVSEVAGVKATSAVGGAKGLGSVQRRRATRTMTLEEREHLFQMVQEEASKMFGEGKLSPERQKTVTEAVKMAIDAGILPDEDSKKGGK